MSEEIEKRNPRSIRDQVSEMEELAYGDCYACGPNNPLGLQLEFFSYENNDREVYAVFQPSQSQAGWPEILHGGVIATLSDEAAAYVAYLRNKHAATARLNIKFKNPTGLNEPVKVTGKLIKETKRILDIEVVLTSHVDGRVLSEGVARLIVLPEHEKIKYGIIT